MASVKIVLGGAATYFSVAASFFTPVKVVAIVGDDFPQSELDFLAGRGIDLAGVVRAKGPTFRWKGRYHEDMNQRDTLDSQLNVFADFQPHAPGELSRRRGLSSSPTSHPALQASVLDQLRSAEDDRRRHDELLDHGGAARARAPAPPRSRS